MACCADGVECPMHKSDSSTPGSRAISQTEADSCCASSETPESGPSASTFIVTVPLAILTVAAVLPAETPVLALRDSWRQPPLLASPVPKHVLLSVFIV